MKSLKLFLLGFVISLAISGFEDINELQKLQDDPAAFLINSFSYSSIFAKLGYFILLIVLLPFVAILPMKKHLTEKHIVLYSFLSGLTFGFAIISFLTILRDIY